jgi:Protein of unknown function (DUF4242)
VAEFLVESYVAQADWPAFERTAKRCRLAAEELTRQGTHVRFLRSIFVPEDETSFLLYEASSATDVREAVGRAALPFERVVATVPAEH